MPILLSFDSDRASVFEIQAAVLAILAWPEDVPDGLDLAAAQVALGGHLIRAAIAADPDFALRPQWMKPVYLLQGLEEMRTIVANTMNRLRQTLRVARIARPFVARARGHDARLPEGIARLSLNQIVPWVLEAEHEPSRDAHSFEEKVARRTYPVLHLAVALEHALDVGERATGKPVPLEALLISDEACARILKQAEILEPVMLAIRRFRVDPDTQVRVRVLSGNVGAAAGT